MRHILLTWNPGPTDDAQWSRTEFYEEMVVGTANGDTLGGRWSVGNRKRGIDVGDKAYLLRQGSHGRGIVASGVVLTTPYEDAHWSEPDKTAQYVDVTWEAAVPVDAALTIEQLSVATDFNWNEVYASGREVTGPDGPALLKTWLTHAHEGVPLPRVLSGAGFGDAQTNKLVEDAAVTYVTEQYLKIERGCTDEDIADVSKQNLGWDLTARLRGDEEHIEVKGAAGSLPRFFLTANEYKAASEDQAWRLVVVTDALTDARRALVVDRARVVQHAAPVVYRVSIP